MTIYNNVKLNSLSMYEKGLPFRKATKNEIGNLEMLESFS
jgi:hypothetical protein